MKSKPVKHKTTNTFRFLPFSERINTIDIRHAALYHIEHEYSERPEDNESHFNAAVRKWYALNLTDNFKKFRKEVHGVITVPQLLHKKDEVFNVLEKYLKLEDQLCLQPLLEILVSLAKDLREDFYAQFPRFLDILIKLLQTKDAEQLEHTLICLAFLFKILKPYLKKDIAIILKRIIPLLSDTLPQYINNFAAESFAFVARDIRDKKRFIHSLMTYLRSHGEGITGCGHLMFEILRGVSGKFHSCIETFLPLLFDCLKDKDHQEIMFKVLTQTLEDSLQTISQKEYEIFWRNTTKSIEDLLKTDGDGLEYILRLAGQVIEHQEGRFLTNPPEFVLLLVKVICESGTESVLEICAQIGALLLISPKINLSQEHAGILIKVLLPLPYPNILINFVNNVIDYSQFELHILPPFLNFVVQSNFDLDSMNVLTKICLKKAPLSKNGIKLFDWVKYPLEFGKALPQFMEYIEKTITTDTESVLANPLVLINALICLPHVEKINVEHCIKLLNTFISKLLQILSSYNIEAQKKVNNYHTETSTISKSARKVLFLLANSIESAIHICGCKNLDSVCDVEKLLLALLPCAANPNYLSALRIVDMYMTALEQENGLKYPYLVLIDSYLKENISSPFHIIRLLTTHIYKLFENLEEFKQTNSEGSTESLSVFSLCYSVESIQPSIQEYRSQINMLQKMTFNSIQYNLIKGTAFKNYPLNYMLGVLYINFKLLWEPVIEFIAGYGNSLSADDFWSSFHEALSNSFANAKKDLKLFRFDDEIDSNNGTYKDLYIDYTNITERPDLYNYRNLMLKIMSNCIQVCEAKNRDVVVLFLNFIEEEYRRNANALKIDVETHDKMEVDEEKDVENIDADELELEEPEQTVSGKIIFKTLINIMQVISQFKNPRALYKEPEFWNLYMEFLKHKNAGLQKFALDCVLNYKNKSVAPYKDNLHNLVDERKFKDELTLFKITEDAQNIHQDDREHVIPIILRILYGKMTSKLGADKKGGGQARRSLVMRYLAGCNENELKIFIEMAFSYFEEYFKMDAKEINTRVKDNLNLKSVTSPGKLHSILNLFDVIREYFGGYMKDELLGHFFKVFYAVSATVASVLAKGDKVHIGYVKSIKNLRVTALGILKKIFDQFERYQWSKDELKILFDCLIFPMLSKLHIEGIHTPTALLKIFTTWSQNPRFYVLLITAAEDDVTLNPISSIFKLLLAPKTSVGVVNVILDMIERLLTLVEDEEEPLPPLESFNSLNLEDNIENINYGSKILIPHISNILEVMKRRIANSAKSNTVNKRDLLILSRVTELVSTPELCDELLSILLPILVKKVCMNMAEENMEYAVTTIINLLGHSTKPQSYIKNISILFNKVAPVEVRKLLIRLLRSIADNCKENRDILTRMADVVTEMNAFNKRWIEQPDFDRRIDIYKQIYKLSEENNIDIDLAILITNNCFFFIRTEKDIGLRDSAGLCLKKVLPNLMMKYRSSADGAIFVRDTVLSLISNGIRDSKNEIIRNESIALLGELARECPDADVVLSDLALLANKEDREVDFFDNMCHLQMHRRVRALNKFCKVVKKMIKCPTPRTLTNFILPLATMYICDDKYTEKNTLIDACIETIAVCSRLLPWYHYEVILKLYLNKMRHGTEHQKQLTRILIGIIDAFHFDFSKAQNIELPKALINNIDNVKVKSALLAAENEKDKKNKQIDANNQRDDENNQEGDAKDENIEEQDLDAELKAADEEMETEEQNKEVNTPAFERVTSVSPSVAKRIIKSLSAGLLPQLNRAISKMTDHEGSHKLNRRRTGLERQEEDMLKVPVALALVKLLQRLPGDLVRYQLPGIIIKLCSFLKSPLKQVRIAARDIVKKIMITVGTSYLEILLEHLTLLLTRGFQVHVLVSTIHTVLDALKGDFKNGELNKNLPYILDVCTNDLFGALSEEKEVDKLHYKTPEAKPSKKSYVTLMIVAQNINEKCLINLLLPFKEVLQKHHSKKVVLKVQDALNHITTGLVTNKFIDIESLFVFLHGMASESIPEFVLGAQKRPLTEDQREKMLRAKPDCFIVPEAPKRNREVQAKHVKLSSKANAHVLIEFSFNILYVILKREMVTKMDCRAFVDPLIPLLVDALKSNHVKVSTVALKCFSALWTNRIETPCLLDSIKEIVQVIFAILHKYATFEMSNQNDNYHLVRNAFKAVTVLIRNVKYHTLQEDQLKTLLLYAEEDCQNDERQVNSFSLLKAILDARLVSAELHEVMDKIAKICILSESAKSREEARLIFVNYLTFYSPGKRMERFIHFFVSQLNYELQHGRESSLKFLEMIISKFPVSQLSKHSGFLLVSLGAAMVNDTASECRQSAALCIETMLGRLPAIERNKLFDLVMAFFNDKQPVHCELASQLSTRFVNIEKEDFKPRLPTLLPIINTKLTSLYDTNEGKFVKLTETPEQDTNDQEKEHSLIQVLNLIEKITIHCCSSITDSKLVSEIDEIAEQCKAFLAHPHVAVRYISVKILNRIVEYIDGDVLEKVVLGAMDNDRGFLYRDTVISLRSLCLDLCAQYVAGVSKELADEVTSLLYKLFKLVSSMPSLRLRPTNERSDDDAEIGGNINVRWILFKMRRAVNVEVARAPNDTNIRTSIFTNWLHLISNTSPDDVTRIIDVIIPPLVRELSVEEAAPLSMVKQLAGRIGKKLRRKIGDIEYSRLVGAAQARLNAKRADRKKVVLQEKVHNPEKAAKRKLLLKEKKKKAKKIKVEMVKGKRARPKKRKAEDIDLEDQLLNGDD